MPERIIPSPQEQAVLRLTNRHFDRAIDDVVDTIQEGKSPNLLSVAKPELAIGFAEAWQRERPENSADDTNPLDEAKAEEFNTLQQRAEEGDPSAIAALFKFSVSLGHVATATSLLLDHRTSVTEWHEDRARIQYIGSFNPQHVGHRTTIQSALQTEGDRSDVILQVVDRHPIKQDLPLYEPRFRAAEDRMRHSPLLDNERVTALDVPAGNGLARDGDAQIGLLAEATGDDELRWLVGSDKFISDVKSAKAGKEDSRAVTRFRHPKMHLYVGRRVDHDPDELAAGIDFIREGFGTKITQLKEAPNTNVLAAAASKIRELRAKGHHEEANQIELADLQ